MKEKRDSRLATNRVGLLLMAVMLFTQGCSQEPQPEWTLRPEVQEWNEDEETQPLYELTQNALLKHAGTRAKPKLLGQSGLEADHFAQGRELYAFYCQQCHGVNGDGQGPAADVLRPRPRDYRKGVFKFTSTPYGNKPQRADLLKTLRRGVSGTSMPSFALLSDEQLEAIIDYVLVLTHRGELENALMLEAEFAMEEEGDTDEETQELRAEYIDDLIANILEKWEDAQSATVYPETPQPRFTAENVENGYKAFLKIGCIKCHGVDGRGATEGEVRKDTWGHITKAADITSGMLHGGSDPLDIYRRIHSGINGTPMPNFSTALNQEPETIWDLVAYVMYLSNVRRNGETPPPIEMPKSGESVLEATMELSAADPQDDDQ